MPPQGETKQWQALNSDNIAQETICQANPEIQSVFNLLCACCGLHYAAMSDIFAHTVFQI
jgi:hypothetical protein